MIDAADQQLRSRDRPATPGVASHGATNNPAGGGANADAQRSSSRSRRNRRTSQPWANSLEFYITPWGFLKGAAENNATASRRKSEGKNYTVLTWSPAVKALSGKAYVINGYVNDNGIVERVETWLGRQHHGRHADRSTYTGWKDFGGVMAPKKIVQTRGGWPFFEVDVAAAKANHPMSQCWFLHRHRRRPWCSLLPLLPCCPRACAHRDFRKAATAYTGSPPDPAATIR